MRLRKNEKFARKRWGITGLIKQGRLFTEIIVDRLFREHTGKSKVNLSISEHSGGCEALPLWPLCSFSASALASLPCSYFLSGPGSIDIIVSSSSPTARQFLLSVALMRLRDLAHYLVD